MRYDIRNDSIEEINKIAFNDSGNCIAKGDGLTFTNSEDEEITLCAWEELDDFVQACYKAHELWSGNDEE